MPEPIPTPDPALNMPSTTCNTFRVAASASHVKMIFGDQHFNDLPPQYFSSVLMTIENARWLADLINKQVDDAEALALKPPQA